MTTLDSPDVDAGSLRERKKRHTRDAIHQAALHLVAEQGLDGTTIDQICAEVEISSRTFFNYFPTKAAAVLGLPERTIAPEAIDRFRSATGELIPAVCDLVAGSGGIGGQRHRLKSIVQSYPQLQPSVVQWVTGLREELAAIIAERVADRYEAETALALVFTGLGTLMHQEDRPEVATAPDLLASVDRMMAVRSATLPVGTAA